MPEILVPSRAAAAPADLCWRKLGRQSLLMGWYRGLARSLWDVLFLDVDTLGVSGLSTLSCTLSICALFCIYVILQ